MTFRRIFHQKHAILPVIHVVNQNQALRNVEIVRKAGADGVFLINHDVNAFKLLHIHAAVKAEHADWWVGVNCLDLSVREIFARIDGTVDGVWADDAGIDERVSIQPHAEKVLAAIEESGWNGLYFGGVAFKYQREVDDLAQAATKAAPYMDVVTTSGPGTGSAASVEKIRTMKQAIGNHPLAIASGVTPENVADYLDCADCFLVATGVSDSSEELNPQRVRSLVESIRIRESD